MSPFLKQCLITYDLPFDKYVKVSVCVEVHIGMIQTHAHVHAQTHITHTSLNFQSFSNKLWMSLHKRDILCSMVSFVVFMNKPEWKTVDSETNLMIYR